MESVKKPRIEKRLVEHNYVTDYDYLDNDKFCCISLIVNIVWNRGGNNFKQENKDN